MPGKLLDNHRDWFGKNKKKVEVAQVIDDDSVDIYKLEEASRFVDQIKRVIEPLVMNIAEKHGEVVFHSSMRLNHDLADRLTTSQIVDKILETAGVNAEKKWADKPMRFMALITVLEERL